MKILIVEDHDATVTFMRLAFTGAGYTVLTASNAESALRQVAEESPDIVLTDLTFGEAAGGLELGRALRASAMTSDVGLLAVSGADAPQVVQAVIDSGFDGFVSKPVHLAELIERVDRLAVTVEQRRVFERKLEGW